VRLLPSLVGAASFLAASAGSWAACQDFQVGSRAKGMGGSYTAFGDDPVAVWANPAGTAAQPTQVALTYQSFTEYEFNHVGDQINSGMYGAAKQGLLDPPISPSFAGVVVQMGDSDVEMAASLAYIRPFQIKYVYFFNGAALTPPDSDLLTQTDQQFSRIRAAYAVSVKLSDSSPFLRRISAGVGLDYVYTTYKEVDQNTDPNRDSQVYEDSESALGFGAGLLATLFETSSFMVDIGVAYNSKVHFHFALDPSIFPVWDWPALTSGGLAFYLLEGYPLRVTVDAQWIGWKSAVGAPAPGFAGFQNTVSYSAGMEYRIPVKSTVWVYPRLGWKSYEAPWASKDNLPALGFSQLQIKTQGNRQEILTTGLGLYWARKTWEGETRLSGIDLAAELFGDAKLLIGVGFTYQLD